MRDTSSLALPIEDRKLAAMVRDAAATSDLGLIALVVRMVAVKMAGGLLRSDAETRGWADRFAPDDRSDWFAQLRWYYRYLSERPVVGVATRDWGINTSAASQAGDYARQIMISVAAWLDLSIELGKPSMKELDNAALMAKLHRLIVRHNIDGLRFVIDGDTIGEAGFQIRFPLAPTSAAWRKLRKDEFVITERLRDHPGHCIWAHPVTVRELTEVHHDRLNGQVQTSLRWVGNTLRIRTNAIFHSGFGRTNSVLQGEEDLTTREAIIPALAHFFATASVETIERALGHTAKCVAETNARLVAAAQEWNGRNRLPAFLDYVTPAARETLFVAQFERFDDFAEGSRMSYVAFMLPELDAAKTAEIAARVPNTVDFEGQPVTLRFHPEIAAVFDLFDLRWYRAGQSLRLPDDRRARVQVKIGSSKEEMPGDVVRGLIQDRPDWLLLQWSASKSAKRDTLKPNSPDAQFPDALEEVVVGYRHDGAEIKVWGGPTQFNRGWGERVADFGFTWFSGRVLAQSALDQMRGMFEVERTAWARHFADITEMRASRDAPYYRYLPGTTRNEMEHALRDGAGREQVRKARELLALNREAALRQHDLEQRGFIRRDFTVAVGTAKDGTVVTIWVLQNDGKKREGWKGDTQPSGLRNRTWEMIGPDELVLQYRKPADGPAEFTVVKLPIGGLNIAQTGAVAAIEDKLTTPRGSWRFPRELTPTERRTIYHTLEEACPTWMTNGAPIPYAANLEAVLGDGLMLDVPSDINGLLEEGAADRTFDGKVAFLVQTQETDVGDLEVLAVSASGGWREVVRLTLKR